MNILTRLATRTLTPIASGVGEAISTAAERFKSSHGGKMQTHQATSDYDKFFNNLMRVDNDESLAKIGMSRHRLEMLLEDDEIDEKVERRLEHLLQAEYTMNPSEGAEADYFYRRIDRLITKILIASVNAKLYGYSVCELIWRSTEMDKVIKIRTPTHRAGEYIVSYEYNGRVISENEYYKLFETGERYIYDIIEKPMEWFEPRNDGTLWWYKDTHGTPIEVDTTTKYLLQQHRATYKNPKGKALLSRVYWLWFFKKNGWTFWSKFLERFGSPLLIGSTAGDPVQMAEALAEAHNQSIFTMVDGDKVNSIGASNGGDTFKAYDDAINRRISKYLLGQTLVSGADSGGTFGQGRVHQDQQEIVFNGDKQFAAPSIQRIIDVSCYMNGMKPPTFVFRIERGAQEGLAQRDMLLTNQGVILSEEYYADKYDIDARYIEGKRDMTENVSADIERQALANSGGLVRAISPEQAELETLMDLGAASGTQPIMASEILAVIKNTPRENLESELFALVGKDLEASAFTEFLATAVMVADTHGMVDETLGN